MGCLPLSGNLFNRLSTAPQRCAQPTLEYLSGLAGKTVVFAFHQSEVGMSRTFLDPVRDGAAVSG
jgi:hypothetical protein